MKSMLPVLQILRYLGEVVCGVPEVEGATARLDATSKGGQAPGGCVMAVQLELAVQPACQPMS